MTFIKCECGKDVWLGEIKDDTGIPEQIDRWEHEYTGICRPLHRCKYWTGAQKPTEKEWENQEIENKKKEHFV